MLARLLLLFILLPLVELALLLVVSDWTSPWFTIGLVIVTGVVGTFLARSQTWRVAAQLRRELSAGKLPADALMDGAMILVAAVTLVTPGVITDICGISLLIPWVRNRLRPPLRRWIRRRVTFTSILPGGEPANSADPIIDGDGDVIDSYAVPRDEKTTE